MWILPDSYPVFFSSLTILFPSAGLLSSFYFLVLLSPPITSTRCPFTAFQERYPALLPGPSSQAPAQTIIGPSSVANLPEPNFFSVPVQEAHRLTTALSARPLSVDPLRLGTPVQTRR